MPGKGRRRPGEGQCGGLGCENPAAPGRYLCATCAEPIDRVREQMYGMDHKSVFSQGGKNPKARKERLGPTCCYVGCYEPRDPGTAFCHGHQGHESD